MFVLCVWCLILGLEVCHVSLRLAALNHTNGDVTPEIRPNLIQVGYYK